MRRLKIIEGEEMGNPLQEIQPLEELNLVLRKWYLLALLGILGGLIGLGVSAVLPPQYEARATLQVALFLPEGQFYTDAQTDYQLNSAIEVVYSAAMLQQLVSSFQSEGKDVETSDLTLERRESTWDLVVRNRDPQLAAEATNAWLDETLARLEEAGAHSLQASELASQIAVLNGCAISQTLPLCASFKNMEELGNAAAALWQQYQQEVAASGGLNPSLTWLVENRASIPTKPVIRQRSTLVLAGMGLGLLLGLPALRISFRKRNP
jgi:uncharacterized protein involved in exopolysaccharide biosynthesis